MARYYGKTTRYGGYSCQHNYHGNKTNQTAWMKIIWPTMSVMITSAINTKTQAYRLKTTTNDIDPFKLARSEKHVELIV